MKITKFLAFKLMDESESFRQFILDTLFGNTVIEDIVQICKNNPNNKIGAIKELRDYSIGKDQEFKDSGLVSVFDGVLGLVDAKRLVEKYGNF
jgi:hypothetical protein